MTIINMKKEIIKELESESPDWLKISKLAKEAYAQSNQSNQIGFRKGAINIIKASDANCSDILKHLSDCFSDTEDYQFILVGAWSGITVTNFNKLIPGLKSTIKSKYVVVVTDKDQVFANSIRNGIEVNHYNAGFKNRYDMKKQTVLNIKGDAGSISCEPKDLKSHIRNLTLEKLLS